MTPKFVKVPREIEPLFAKAEAAVSSYFARCTRDPSRGTIEIGEERYVLVRAAALSTEFFLLVRKLFGTGREREADQFARNLLFDLAHAVGKSDARCLHARMHLDDPIARLSAGPVHFAHAGWAFVDISPQSRPVPNEDYCLIYDHPYSFEADAWLRQGLQADLPVCVMNAGYSSGWCEESFGLPLVAVEILCRARGDACCRFVMAPPDRIADQAARHCDGSPVELGRKTFDIPELFARKRIEEELRRSEQRYRLLVEQIPGVTYTAVIDDVRSVTYVSPQIETLLGFTQAEWMADRSLWATQIHPDDRQRVLTEVASAAENTLLVLEYRLLSRDGRVVWVRDEARRASCTLDGLVLLQGVMIDVSDRRRAEETLRKKDEELRQAQKLEVVGRLAGGIAHEFSNLLQAISGYTECAMEGLCSEDHRYEDLEQVMKAAERAGDLTQQLLGFSRRQVMERRNIDPNQLLGDLAKMVRPVIGENIELKLALGEHIPMVCGDPCELQQVLLNLCLNARHAMPSGGELLLKTETARLNGDDSDCELPASVGDHVVLVVTDTGCGMTPEVKERIFEPFFTTKEVGKGTGLGLANVYGAMQRHGGTIRVYSEPGKGTTFRLYFPVAESTVDEGSSNERPCAAGGDETILVAEDEPQVRDLAARILKGAGYSVLVARDGEEALRVFDENRGVIALVLLDAVMPKMSGHEVFERIRQVSPHLKTIFCTGYDPDSAHCSDLRREKLPLIQKPFDAQMLLRTVRQVLDAE